MPFVALFVGEPNSVEPCLLGELHGRPTRADPALDRTLLFSDVSKGQGLGYSALDAWTPNPPSSLPISNSIFFSFSSTQHIRHPANRRSPRFHSQHHLKLHLHRIPRELQKTWTFRPTEGPGPRGRGPGHIAGFGLVRVRSGGLPLFLAACRRLQMRTPAANPWASLWRRQADPLSTRRPAPAATPPLNLPYHMARRPPRA